MELEQRLANLTNLCENVTDPLSKMIFAELFNIIEELYTQNKVLKNENQQLRDEINRLKGEQGKPSIRPNTRDKRNISSEKERSSQKKKWKKRAKKADIPIDNTVHCVMDTADLPADAVFKYSDTVIQQDIVFERKNTLFKVDVYYSPSEKKTYRAALPAEYSGYHANGLKTFALTLHNVCDVTSNKILGFIQNTGIEISKGALSSILLGQNDWIFNEKNEILRAGLDVSYAQADATASRVRGVNHHTQIICNDFFTSYTTLKNRTRLDVLAAFQGVNDKNDLLLIYNNETAKLLEVAKVPENDRLDLSEMFYKRGSPITLENFCLQIQNELPDLFNKTVTFTKVKEAFAFANYHSQDEYPVVELLITDDASEYNKIAVLFHALCWIHDARFYKKLMPIVKIHQEVCCDFMKKYWDYYNRLLDYKKQPTINVKNDLENDFNQLFVPDKIYAQLNTCIKRTLKNKKQLLAVLEHPQLPLHNNTSELGARQKARKRDISYHTMTPKGTAVQDAWMTIVHTAMKLGVNIYSHINQIVNNTVTTPLPDVIYQKAECAK